MEIRATLVCVVFLSTLSAQEAKPQPIYRLSFSVAESDAGQIVSDRKYSIVVADQNTGTVHAGVRIPYMPSENHLNMAAIGIIIECKVRSVEPDVSIDCSLESSAIAARQPSMPAGYPPVVSTIQSRVSVVLRLGAKM